MVFNTGQTRGTVVLITLLLLWYAVGCCLRQGRTAADGRVCSETCAAESISDPERLSWDNEVLEEGGLAPVVPAGRTGRFAAMKSQETVFRVSRGLDKPRNEMNLQATAYTHTGHPTFTGVYPRVGTIAVDPKVIPLGTRMWVEGYGYGIAQDTGGLIKGNVIDLFMDTEEECRQWGRRSVKVYIFE